MPFATSKHIFSYAPANIPLSFPHAGSPPLKNLDKFRRHSFTDRYYDSENKLFDAGIWLRKRIYHVDWQSRWEMERTVHPGSSSRSTVSDHRDLGEIVKHVCTVLPGWRWFDDNDDDGLDEIAVFATHTTSVLADDEFTVVFDETHFGHRIGEVEVFAEDWEKAHKDIDEFLNKYSWLCDTAKPKGKLTAYFEEFGYPKGSKRW